MRKRRAVGSIYGMKFSWKGHKERNRHKNRIKRSGLRWFMSEINCNISTTWRWSRRDASEYRVRKVHQRYIEIWWLVLSTARPSSWTVRCTSRIFHSFSWYRLQPRELITYKPANWFIYLSRYTYHIQRTYRHMQEQSVRLRKSSSKEGACHIVVCLAVRMTSMMRH